MTVASIAQAESWTTPGVVARAQFAFAAILALIYLPSVLFVYGVMADAEQVFFKSDGLISHEAMHLAGIGRPIAALFANVPLYFLDTLADYRFARVFSLLTLILAGCAMIQVLAARLWIRPAVAVIVALGTLCLPGFIFSLMNPTAWPMHLLSIVFAVAAYGLWARSHATSLFLATSLLDLDRRGIREALLPSSGLGSAVGALILFELSLFTYPPNSLLILVFPVAMLLFSALPTSCKLSLLLRDLALVSGGIVLFILISKLLYFPVGHFLKLLPPVIDSGPNAIYRFEFNFDLQHVTERLLDSVRVAKDLWFLPNFENAVLGGYAAVAALTLLMWLQTPRRSRPTGRGILVAGAIIGCYIISVTPLIFSLGGLISYRTVIAATAIVMLAVLYFASEMHRAVVLRLTQRVPWLKSDAVWLLPVLLAIYWTTSYGICSVIQISQNELAWVAATVRAAKAKQAEGLVFIDGRSTISPEELRIARDAHGHALLPYESGCFSTYCIFAPGIYETAKVELGLPRDAIQVMIVRDESLRGATCDTLRGHMLTYGGLLGWSTSSRFAFGLHEFLQRYPKFECREYTTKWADLEWHADSSILNSSARIDRSIWRVFLPTAK